MQYMNLYIFVVSHHQLVLLIILVILLYNMSIIFYILGFENYPKYGIFEVW